jgi:hypothetical protein
MQSLEAALHLAWKAAEAAAKSIGFVSREGISTGKGWDDRASSGEMMQIGRRVGAAEDEAERMDGVLCRCCDLFALHGVVLNSDRLESWPGLFPETPGCRLRACLACSTLVEMRPWPSSSEHQGTYL